MNIDEALTLYEQYLILKRNDDSEKKEQPKHDFCDDCKVYLIVDTQHKVCPSCGLVSEPDYVLSMSRISTCRVSKRSIYIRRAYFVERLNLIAGYKICLQHSFYKKCLKQIKKHEFETINELRKVMKGIDNCEKLYKYIYNIYYDIKNVRLIKLSRREILYLAEDFVRMESFFKKHQDQHNRKNMFSYSILIYMILKRHKIKGYKHVLLPRQTKVVTKKIHLFCVDTLYQ